MVLNIWYQHKTQNRYITFSKHYNYSEDQLVAASGHGGYCPEGIPVEFALLSILGMFGVAFGFLYRALTMTTGTRKRRSNDGVYFNTVLFSNIIGDMTWAGWFVNYLIVVSGWFYYNHSRKFICYPVWGIIPTLQRSS